MGTEAQSRSSITRRLTPRQISISLFALLWSALFHYETLRLAYLSPLAGRELPKTKFLYPPAGWIMFYQVDRSYGFAEVYGLKGAQSVLIDPHDIFSTRAVGYDNIRRNVLVSVLPSQTAPSFCAFLQRKFPQYDRFAVVYSLCRDVVNRPNDVQRYLAYQCP